MLEEGFDPRSQDLLDAIRHFHNLGKANTSSRVNPFSETPRTLSKDAAMAKTLLFHYEQLLQAYMKSESDTLRLLMDIEKLGSQETHVFRAMTARRIAREIDRFN